MRNLTVLLKVLQHSFSKKGEVALDFAGIDFLFKKKKSPSIHARTNAWKTRNIIQ